MERDRLHQWPRRGCISRALVRALKGGFKKGPILLVVAAGLVVVLFGVDF